MSVLLICLLLLLVLSSSALKNIYLIRHCDKIDDDNPCCSNIGYARANSWSNVIDVLLAGKTVSIYSALADYTTLCRPNLFFKPDSSCQHSQRLAMTYINYNINSTATMSLDYCVGQYKKIVNDINNHAASVNRALIIWQHDEMLDIMRSYNVKITDWPLALTMEYSIIFQLQFSSNSDSYPELSYNCYDFQANRLFCNEEINSWLFPFPQFNLTLSR